MNKLESWATDLGNAYLEACTSEKVYYILGVPEVGELEGHILVVVSKSLYGLPSRGARWNDKFANTMREHNFFECKELVLEMLYTNFN